MFEVSKRSAFPGSLARSAFLLWMLCLLGALSQGDRVLAQEVDAPEAADTGTEDSGEVDHSDIVVDPDLHVLHVGVQRVRTISLLEGALKGQVYWYMVYTVDNRTGEDQKSFISVTATSDRGKRYADVHLTAVEEAVERKMGRPLWGKSDLFEAQKSRDREDREFYYTEFKAGKKKECVAIFNRLDPMANHITISIRGLSNDHHLIEQDDGTRIIEERVYRLEFERAGDPYEINLDEFELKKKHWVKKRTRLVIPEGDGEGDASGA